MWSEEYNTEDVDGVGLFVDLVTVATDFTITVIGPWEYRHKGCSKKDKALFMRRRNAYIRWVREITRRVVSYE